MGYSSWGHKESDMTEHTRTHFECTSLVSPVNLSFLTLPLGFPGGVCGKEPSCQCWIGKENEGLILRWEDPLEEGMATHFSILAWRIPWTEEPGGLQSIGSQRVGHD